MKHQKRLLRKNISDLLILSGTISEAFTKPCAVIKVKHTVKKGKK